MDRISGKRMLAVLNKLARDRTVLRLNALGTGYEGLTIATGVVREKDTSYLLVDYPAGFREEVRRGERGRIRIEFLGPDRVPYNLRTTLLKVAGSDLWLDLPQFIERIQRRRHFRVAPPAGSKIVFSKDNTAFESSIIDLNLGGALTSCRIADSGQARLFVNDQLVNLTLSCPSNDTKVCIPIKKAVVKRVEEESVRDRTRYALQFTDMGAEERRALETWILGYQRELLRRRSLLGGE